MELLPELVEYSPVKLECLARELFRSRPDIPRAAPIKLELLIETTENVTLEIEDDLKLNHKVEGCVCKEPRTKLLTSFLDMATYRGPWDAYNAVLGEEFAHIYLHPAVFLKVESVADFIELQHKEIWHQVERDAKRFSRIIRLPMELVDQQATESYAHFARECGFSDSEVIEKAIRHEIAQRFRVPPSDVQKRMLDYPGILTDRIRLSALARHPTLVSADYAVSVRSQMTQKGLFKQTGD